jgi:starch synthase
VLVLTREYPPHVYGGAGVVVDQLSRALSREMAVEVRCFGARSASPDGVVVRGYPGWPQMSPHPGGPPFLPVLETMSVALAMARDPVEADVVHAHTWYADLAGFLVRTLYRIPLVLTLHSLEPLRPWKAEQLGTGHRLSAWIEQTGVHVADRIIAVSAGMRDDVLRSFPVDPARVVVVHNGVDADRFRRTGRREALARRGVRPPYVLFVGRVSEQKGIFDLLDAAALLPAEVQVVLCAASPETPALEARLRAAVQGRPNVLWLAEMVPVDEVVELYSHAAVFACPSIYEPFGLINLEAMACETPVVASAVGGIPEVVEDGVSGVLVPPGRPAALAAAIRALLADPERARRLGMAGRQRVEARFAWPQVAARTTQVYRDAVETFRLASG